VSPYKSRRVSCCGPVTPRVVIAKGSTIESILRKLQLTSEPWRKDMGKEEEEEEERDRSRKGLGELRRGEE
jgi:hypothetical protein